MKKNIDNYIGSIVHDNEDAIMNGWYSSIADYIIHNAENGAGWYDATFMELLTIVGLNSQTSLNLN